MGACPGSPSCLTQWGDKWILHFPDLSEPQVPPQKASVIHQQPLLQNMEWWGIWGPD